MERHSCSICGKALSSYNRTGKCFHHKFDNVAEEDMPIRTTPGVYSLCAGMVVDRYFRKTQAQYNGR